MTLSSFPNGFAQGVAIQNMPLLNTYSGTVFWVDDAVSGGSNGNNGTFRRPFATIDYAIGQCTSGRGDVIMVKSGYAETVTAAIAADVAGIAIIGMGTQGSMPAITGNGTIDAITVTADNVTIANLQFPAPSLDAQTADINIAAAGCAVLNTRHIGSQTAKNKVSVITITAAGHDFLLDGSRIYNDVVEVPQAISIEGACARGEIRGCVVQGGTTGYTNGAIVDGDTATQLFIHDNVFGNTKADTAVMAFSNNSTGACARNFINGRHTTIQSNVTTGTGMAFFEQYGVEEAAKNGLLMPVVDAE